MSLSPELVDAVRAGDGLGRFFRTCVVQDELTGNMRRLAPSSTQVPLLRAMRRSRRVVCCKPRQCYASTACVVEALRRTEYWPGHHGAIITNLADTSSTLFDRVLTAYRHQDPSIQVPSARKGRGGIEFAHGGTLKVLTARGSDPGVGSSLDFLHASEFGSWPHARDIMTKIMPALSKRPHSRVVIESTPSLHGSAYHEFWLDSLSGKTGYDPVFVAWWEHLSYADQGGEHLLPTPEEEELLRTYPGMTRGHLAFRRRVLDEDCFGDERLFARQYPYDATSGWTTSLTPALPEADLRALLPGRPDPAYLQAWEPHVAGHRYLLCADPNSYGSAGDPSAYTLWDGTTRTEVASWCGRIDPVRFGTDLVAMCKRYGDALLVIESNAAACITAAKATGYKQVWHNNSHADHPGYYRTAQAKERSVAAMVDALRRKSFTVRSQQGLTQLLNYDGTDSKKDGHHWDRYVTYTMVADMFVQLRFPAALRRDPLPPGTYNLMDMKRDIERRAP